MALSYADGEIGQNSLEMIPFEEQEYGDFCTGEILVSAMKARSDYECTYATPESFASLGPLVQQEVAQSIQSTRANVQMQTAITQATVDALSSPVISDAAIANAPNAVSVGSPGAVSPFTKRQVEAAGSDPINWAATLTIQETMRRNVQIRRLRAVTQQQRIQQAQNPQQAVAQPIGLQPVPSWGDIAGSTRGWCGVGGSPWGKLLLFTGLGLIGASLLDRK